MAPAQPNVGSWLQRRKRKRSIASAETAGQNGEQRCDNVSSAGVFLKISVRVNGTVKEDTLVAMKQDQPENDEWNPTRKPFSRNDDRASGVLDDFALKISSSDERSPNSLCLPDQLMEMQPLMYPNTGRNALPFSLTPCRALPVVTSSKLEFDQGMDAPLDSHTDNTRATDKLVTTGVLNKSNSTLSQVQQAGTKLEVEPSHEADNDERVSDHSVTDKYDTTKRSTRDATQYVAKLCPEEEVEKQTQPDAVEMGGYDVAGCPANPPNQEHSRKIAGDFNREKDLKSITERINSGVGPSIDSVLSSGHADTEVLTNSDQSMVGKTIDYSVDLSEADEESRQSQSESQRNQRVVMLTEVVSSDKSESQFSCTQGSSFSQLMTQPQGGFCVYPHPVESISGDV